jgi:hypothetical protein
MPVVTDSVTHKPVPHALVSAGANARDVTGADGSSRITISMA